MLTNSHESIFAARFYKEIQIKQINTLVVQNNFTVVSYFPLPSRAINRRNHMLYKKRIIHL